MPSNRPANDGICPALIIKQRLRAFAEQTDRLWPRAVPCIVVHRFWGRGSRTSSSRPARPPLSKQLCGWHDMQLEIDHAKPRRSVWQALQGLTRIVVHPVRFHCSSPTCQPTRVCQGLLLLLVLSKSTCQHGWVVMRSKNAASDPRNLGWAQ